VSALVAITSAIAWNGHLATIPLSLLAGAVLYKAQSRVQAYATLFSYYLGASWPLIPASRAFFGTRTNALAGTFLCLGAVSLLAIPAALLFTRDRKKLPFAISGIFLLTALPPLGIIGWASPLLSAGVLFPGTRWLGLIAILAIIPLLGRFPLKTATLTTIVALLVNTFYNAPSLPAGWQAVNTEFRGAGQADPDLLLEFNAHEEMQDAINRSNARVLLFPEHVVTQWNEATETFWNKSLQGLARRQATILVGAGLRRRGGPDFLGGRRYYNVLIARGQETQTVYYQRIPVPLGMWKPLSGDGVPLNLFGPGTISVQNQRAAVLICYEQLLVWPFVSSAFEHPTIVVTAANDYWVKDTPIPQIQNASASSSARLFGLPVLSAVNE
jgi:apolipoprotein N-acyltransferase